MATIKSFTDLNQAKVLSKILPLESADMCYSNDGTAIKIDANPYTVRYSMWKDYVAEIIPCWSLAALLEQLKSEIRLENKQILFLHLNKYDDNSYEIRYTNSWTGEVLIAESVNPIDACVAMIIKLNEMNLL